MVKINREEYKFLKNLDDKWKWIARNRDGGLYKFQETPEKIDSFRWNDRQQTWLGIYGNLFQFVQWEDEEPYNIQELIDEYLDDEYGYFNMKLSREFEEFIKKESENEKMKKGIEWLKEEIWKQDIVMDKGYIYTDDLMSIINEVDETEVKRLERKIKELDSYNDELVRDNNQFRNELDNQEVLSEEWIDKHSNGPSRSQYVWVDDLKEILVPKLEITEGQVMEWLDNNDFYCHATAETVLANAVDKGELGYYGTKYSVVEKPTIPKFIAEAIEEDKERGYDVYDSIDLIIETNGGGLPSISDWVAINIEKYARAWLLGYTVEEEQKYIVSDNSSIPLLIKNDSGEIVSYDSQIAYNNSNGTIELTEQEIRSYDERYMAFAKPVEELE